MRKSKIIPILSVGAALLLGGCFNNEEKQEAVQADLEVNYDEITKILDEKEITNDFETYKELINARKNVLVTLPDKETIQYGDIESKLIDVYNYDYVNYILNTMLNVSIDNISPTPTEEELETFSNTLKSINSIENNFSNAQSGFENNSYLTSDEVSDKELALWKKIELIKHYYYNGKDMSQEELLEFYNSDSINKEQYNDLEKYKAEIKTKFYQSAISAYSNDLTIKAISDSNFTFEKDFDFMKDVVQLYASNDPETLEKIEAMGITFRGLKDTANDVKVFNYKDQPYTIADIKETAVKNTIGIAVIDEIFNRQILKEYTDDKMFETLMNNIVVISGVHYFDDSYKNEIKKYISLMMVANKYNITSDKEVLEFYEKNKETFDTTLTGDLANFENSKPIIYANYLLNEKSDELTDLKILVTSDIDYTLHSSLLDKEIKMYLFDTYNDND